MGRGSRTTVNGRALVGVIALYALLLQAFLAAATPLVPLRFVGELCLTHDGSSAPSPDTPVRHDHACCTVGHVGVAAPPPFGPAKAAREPTRPVLVVWRPDAVILRTGPPTHAHSPRGPPLG